MRHRFGYRKQPRMREILEKITNENVLNLSLTLIKQIRDNDGNHRIANLEDGKLFKKHQDYIKKSHPIRKEMVYYQFFFATNSWMVIQTYRKGNKKRRRNDN